MSNESTTKFSLMMDGFPTLIDYDNMNTDGEISENKSKEIDNGDIKKKNKEMII